MAQSQFQVIMWAYRPPGAWETDSTNVSSCARSKSGVRVTSTRNAFFSFNFTGAFPRLINANLNLQTILPSGR